MALDPIPIRQGVMNEVYKAMGTSTQAAVLAADTDEKLYGWRVLYTGAATLELYLYKGDAISDQILDYIYEPAATAKGKPQQTFLPANGGIDIVDGIFARKVSGTNSTIFIYAYTDDENDSP